MHILSTKHQKSSKQERLCFSSMQNMSRRSIKTNPTINTVPSFETSLPVFWRASTDEFYL